MTSITPITTVTVSLPKLSEADQKKFDTVKANLQSALNTLKSSKNGKSESSAQRKAMAQQKIAQIKQSIKALRQVRGLDAKATARMIAQLSKQLSEAVKDYQAAGGGDSSVSAADSTATGATANNATDNTAKTDGTQSTAVNAYAQTQKLGTDSASDDADKAFYNDVIQLKNDLRSFAKQLRNSIKSGFSSPLDPDLKDVRAADSALDEVDRALTSSARIG